MTTFLFTGQNTYLNKTITNPYSGQIYYVDGTYLMNTGFYAGAEADYDVLFMSVEHDAMFLMDEDDNPTFQSIELFLGSLGNDIIILSHPTYVLGDITVTGDDGDDLIWSSVGNDTIAGGEGHDILDGGPGNDFLIGGTGNDWLRGGDGDDTLWGEDGDDYMIGDAGADALEGGAGIDTIDYTVSPAAVQVNLLLGTGTGGHAEGDTIVDVENIIGSDHNDTLTGNHLNNTLHGGDGNDMLIGGDGDDILYGGNSDSVMLMAHDFVDNFAFPSLKEGVHIQNLAPPGTPALGVSNDNLDFGFETTATITFRKGFAGYNNTLGVYRIAEDGTIEAASVLWNNVKTAGKNITHTVDLPFSEGGGEIGFFIISDGNSKNGSYTGLNTGAEGNIKFVYDYGGANERPATVNDSGAMVKVIYDDGTTVRVLKGDHYHTTDRGGSTGINSDGKSHMVSGEVDNADGMETLRIGFEDLRNLGDADYEDVLFDLAVQGGGLPEHFVGDVLIGGAGNDTFYGGDGTDIMVVGEGLDHIYGEGGIDLIIFDTMDSFADMIYGFETGRGGDILDISQILQGYDSTSDAIADFVQLVQNGGHTELHVNQNGDANGAFTALAIFDSGIGSTLTDLINSGNLITDSAYSYGTV